MVGGCCGKWWRARCSLSMAVLPMDATPLKGSIDMPLCLLLVIDSSESYLQSLVQWQCLCCHFCFLLRDVILVWSPWGAHCEVIRHSTMAMYPSGASSYCHVLVSRIFNSRQCLIDSLCSWAVRSFSSGVFFARCLEFDANLFLSLSVWQKLWFSIHSLCVKLILLESI